VRAHAPSRDKVNMYIDVDIVYIMYFYKRVGQIFLKKGVDLNIICSYRATYSAVVYYIKKYIA
jgi:hypothetical protein